MNPEFIDRYLGVGDDREQQSGTQGGAVSEPDLPEEPAIGEPEVGFGDYQDREPPAAGPHAVAPPQTHPPAAAPPRSLPGVPAPLPPTATEAPRADAPTDRGRDQGGSDLLGYYTEGDPHRAPAGTPAAHAPQGYGPSEDQDRPSAPPPRDEPPPPAQGHDGWDQVAPAQQGWDVTDDGMGRELRVDQFSKSRREPPEMGWRHAVYVGSWHSVNLGAGPAERRLRDSIAEIGSNIPGNYQVAVVSLKGGVGKSRTTAGVGTVFGTYRTEPVVAIDANPTYGSLARVIAGKSTATIREFLADPDVQTYPKARSYTGKNKQGLEVLGGNQNVANPYGMSEKVFTDTLARTTRFYQLALIDCGSDMEHPVMRGVLRSVNALVIVGGMNVEAAEGAQKTIDWLHVRNRHELLRRSILVLNDASDSATSRSLAEIRQKLGPRVGAVSTVPFDPHLRDGAQLDFPALARRTQLAYIEVAAWLAGGFATTGARPR